MEVLDNAKALCARSTRPAGQRLPLICTMTCRAEVLRMIQVAIDFPQSDAPRRLQLPHFDPKRAAWYHCDINAVWYGLGGNNVRGVES
jgi:hypothetical protein